MCGEYMFFMLIVSISGLMSFLVFLFIFNMNPFLLRRVVRNHVIPDVDKAMSEQGDLFAQREKKRDGDSPLPGVSFSEDAEDDAMKEEGVPVAGDSFAALRDLYGRPGLPEADGMPRRGHPRHGDSRG